MKAFRVLHVDDEADYLQLVALFLNNVFEHLVLESVSSPFEALQRLTTQSYDVIVSDYHMTELTGLALLKTLRERGDTTPFIILTGEIGDTEVREALCLGTVHYLHKDLNLCSLCYQLLDIIWKVLKAKRDQANENLDESRQMESSA